MIYTTYFANLKNLPNNIIPIAICGKFPENYSGLEYKKLAPKYEFFSEWKKTHDNDYYIDHFNREVLNTLSADKVVNELRALSGTEDFALVCYEKTGFCHRHLVAKWLTDNGYPVKEFEPKDVNKQISLWD